MDSRGKRSIGVLAVGDRTGGNQTGEGGGTGTSLTRRVLSISAVYPIVLGKRAVPRRSVGLQQACLGGGTDLVLVSWTPIR